MFRCNEKKLKTEAARAFVLTKRDPSSTSQFLVVLLGRSPSLKVGEARHLEFSFLLCTIVPNPREFAE